MQSNLDKYGLTQQQFKDISTNKVLVFKKTQSKSQKDAKKLKNGAYLKRAKKNK